MKKPARAPRTRVAPRRTTTPPDDVRGAQPRPADLVRIVAAAPAVLYACEPAGAGFACSFIGENVREHVGWEARQFLESPSFWREHLHPEDAPAVRASLSALPEGRTMELLYRFRRKDGSWCRMRDEFRAVRDGAGGVVELVGCWANVGPALTGAERQRPARVRRPADPKVGHVAADPLTVRQREVLRLIAEGHGTRGIAALLGLSVKTVETHRAHLMHRLDLHDVASLVRYAIRVRLVPVDR